MQWENLTAGEFKKAMENTGVCIIAMGVLEKHGDHLPLGTDFLNGHKLACLAAEKEPEARRHRTSGAWPATPTRLCVGR